MGGGQNTGLPDLLGRLHLNFQAVDSLLQDKEQLCHAIVKLSVAYSTAAIPSPL